MATWAETGKVHLWDVRTQIRLLDAAAESKGEAGVAIEYVGTVISVLMTKYGFAGAGAAASSSASARVQKPVHTFGGHGTEGFALDWSRVVRLMLSAAVGLRLINSQTPVFSCCAVAWKTSNGRLCFSYLCVGCGCRRGQYRYTQVNLAQ